MKLSIVIPAFNEENRLPASLVKIYKWLDKQDFSWEIIVVDDGSSDAMLAKLKALPKQKNLKIISYKPNRGKGYALKKGILAAKGEIIIFTDADLSTPISETEKIILSIQKGSQVVAGSRLLKESEVEGGSSLPRRLAAKIFLWGAKILLFYGPKDTQCGFKGFTGEAGRKIFKKIKSTSVLFDLEIFLLAKKFGYKIAEIPVVWKHDPDSRLTYNLKKSLFVWKELLRLKSIYKIIFPIKIKPE
jgi:dolichyl-phosphate beta-glucosyltransferase